MLGDVLQASQKHQHREAKRPPDRLPGDRRDHQASAAKPDGARAVEDMGDVIVEQAALGWIAQTLTLSGLKPLSGEHFADAPSSSVRAYPIFK
jgi:hypothetical protein